MILVLIWLMVLHLHALAYYSGRWNLRVQYLKSRCKDPHLFNKLSLQKQMMDQPRRACCADWYGIGAPWDHRVHQVPAWASWCKCACIHLQLWSSFLSYTNRISDIYQTCISLIIEYGYLIAYVVTQCSLPKEQAASAPFEGTDQWSYCLWIPAVPIASYHAGSELTYMQPCAFLLSGL